MQDLVYLGNIANVVDYFCTSNRFNLTWVICEEKAVSPDLLTVCYLRKIPLLEVNDKNDLTIALNKLPLQSIFVMCSFGIILSPEMLSNRSIFNIHFGDLPQYKGRHPSYFATVEGQTSLGITLHCVVPGIDEGDIISIKKAPYYFWMNELDIFNSLEKKIPLIIEDLFSYCAGKLDTIPNIGGKYYPKVSDQNKMISPDMDVSLILNIIRAQAKFEGGVFRCLSGTYTIQKARINKMRNIDYDIIIDKIVYMQDKSPVGIFINDDVMVEFLKKKKIL